MYKVYLNNKSIKTYPHKIQCIIWAILNRYATCRNGYDIRLVPEIKIKRA